MDFSKKPIGITHCQTCGKELTNKQKNSRQRYCSRNCSPWPLITERYICKACGKEFKPNQRENTTYCSKRCSGDGKRKSNVWHHCKVYFPVCEICGEVFISRIKCKHWLCSNECKKVYKRKRYKEQYFVSVKKTNPFIVKQCKECMKEFIVNYYADVRVFCSDKCVKRFFKRERRHRKKDRFVESVSLGEIYLRDNGVCQLCGLKVNMNCRVPHPKSPTIDHIIPISLGGTHEQKNAQLAHFICNSRRGNKGWAQLRLM